MSLKSKAELGLHKIECAGCGCEVKSNQITLGKFSKLPFCPNHAEENYERFPITIKPQIVPHPTGQPADKFKTFDA